jgi:V8-like Glu-specific endopeptidase
MSGHLPFSTSALIRLARGLAGLLAAGPRPEARRPARLGVESLEDRLALSLTPIAANAGYPYTTMVEIQATFPDHKTFVGTGVLVDRFHVLTAGHMTYSSADGGFASRIAVTPELNGYSQPFGTAYMTYERTYNAFVNYDRAHPHSTAPGDYDVGLLTLDRTIGDRTGWMSFGYDNNNADFSAGHILNTSGYPAAGGYDGRHLEYSGGAIAGLSAGGSAIQYYQSAITTYGGQSGSPVWRYNPSTGSRVVYGVHVGGTGAANSLNFATRCSAGPSPPRPRWRATPPRTPAASCGRPGCPACCRPGPGASAGTPTRARVGGLRRRCSRTSQLACWTPPTSPGTGWIRRRCRAGAPRSGTGPWTWRWRPGSRTT